MSGRLTHFGPFSPAPFAPPPPSLRTDEAHCKLCAQRIVFIEMLKKDGTLGQPMPCDPQQRYGDGTRHLVVRVQVGEKIYGRLVPKAGEDALGFEPHFGTCAPYLEQRARERAAREAAAAAPASAPAPTGNVRPWGTP